MLPDSEQVTTLLLDWRQCRCFLLNHKHEGPVA
jgi:hypothetical protein